MKFAKQWVSFIEEVQNKENEILKRKNQEKQKELQSQLDRLLELRIQGDIEQELFTLKNAEFTSSVKTLCTEYLCTDAFGNTAKIN